MMKFNNRGSILQIVLVVFMTMSFSLSIALFIIRSQVSENHMIDIMMKQKNIEIMLVQYYVSQLENSILVSDFYEDENCEIRYIVDDMGEYQEIDTIVNFDKIEYEFIVWICINDYKILKFEYVEV